MAQRYESLDGVRGLAVLLVLAGHILDTLFAGTPAFGTTHPIAAMSAMAGMTLFFILSGVVMFLGYGQTNPFSWRAGIMFFGARFARLYPLYFLTLLFYGGYSALHDRPIIAISYLTMTQSWFNYMLYTFAPAWSISSEWFFYLIFFAIFLPLHWVVRSRSESLGIVATNQQRALMWSIAVILPTGLHWMIFKNLAHLDSSLSFLHNSSSSALFGWLEYFNPYTRILEFILGIATGILLKSDDRTSFPKFIVAGTGLAVSLGLFTAFFLRPGFGAYIQSNYLYAPVLSGLILVSLKGRLAKRLFQSRFMVRTGNISYSLYLLQFAIMTLATTMIPGSDLPSKVIKAIVSIIFSYCIAYGSFHLIERPTQSVIRGALSRWVGAKKPLFNSRIEAITPRTNHPSDPRTRGKFALLTARF